MSDNESPTQPTETGAEQSVPQYPFIVLACYVLGFVHLLGGGVACIAYWPLRSSINPHYEASVLSLLAGASSGFLFFAIGHALHALTQLATASRATRDILQTLLDRQTASARPAPPPNAPPDVR